MFAMVEFEEIFENEMMKNDDDDDEIVVRPMNKSMSIRSMNLNELEKCFLHERTTPMPTLVVYHRDEDWSSVMDNFHSIEEIKDAFLNSLRLSMMIDDVKERSMMVHC